MPVSDYSIAKQTRRVKDAIHCGDLSLQKDEESVYYYPMQVTVE